MKCDSKIYLCSDDGKKFFGKGPAALLMEIDQVHSIKKAASNLGLSFGKAMTLIHNAEKAFNTELLIKKSGGKGGGGSELTPEGKAFIEKYLLFEKKAKSYVETAYREVFDDLPDRKNGDI